MSGKVRHTVLFTGRVQGVGFRYTTRQVAADYAITGYVRNLPDGRVEVLVEGQVDEIQRFIETIEREMAGHIRDRQVVSGPATGEFDDFHVRH